MVIIDRLHLNSDPKWHVAVLTGAGISAESGVPIFRGKGSMWKDEKNVDGLHARAGNKFFVGLIFIALLQF